MAAAELSREQLLRSYGLLGTQVAPLVRGTWCVGPMMQRSRGPDLCQSSLDP